MTEVTLAAACKLCGGPVSKKNTSGFCRKNPECKRESQRVADARYQASHPGKAAEKWAAYGPGYKERRAELDRKRYGERRRAPKGEGRSYEEKLAAVQAFKTDPANAERVREYNRRGRQKYMARSDRPCLSADGCTEHARVGSKFCAGHARVEASLFYYRTAESRRQALAERQDWTCPWCREYLPPSLSRTHVDHVIPRASGIVIEEDWNFQLLHGRCNQQKSDRITPQAVALAAEHGLVLHVHDST